MLNRNSEDTECNVVYFHSAHETKSTCDSIAITISDPQSATKADPKKLMQHTMYQENISLADNDSNIAWKTWNNMPSGVKKIMAEYLIHEDCEQTTTLKINAALSNRKIDILFKDRSREDPWKCAKAPCLCVGQCMEETNRTQNCLECVITSGVMMPFACIAVIVGTPLGFFADIGRSVYTNYQDHSDKNLYQSLIGQSSKK